MFFSVGNTVAQIAGNERKNCLNTLVDIQYVNMMNCGRLRQKCRNLIILSVIASIGCAEKQRIERIPEAAEEPLEFYCYGEAERDLSPPSVVDPSHAIVVAPDGDDASSGSVDDPLRTVQCALTLLREQPYRGAILLRGGIYPVEETIVVSTGDSGSRLSPRIIGSWPGERAVLRGGVTLRREWFSPLDPASPLASGMDQAVVNQIVCIALGDHGISDFGELGATGWGMSGRRRNRPLEVYSAGRRQELARWPNEGFVRVASAINSLSFSTDPQRIKRWSNTGEWFLSGYFFWPWCHNRVRVLSIESSGVVTLADAPNYGIGPEGYFHFYNVREELDSPGEYYLDRDSGTLLWYPQDDAADLYCSMLTDAMVELRDVSWFELRDLVIEGGRGDGLLLGDVRDVLVRGCTIRNVGGMGVVLHGVRSGLSRCVVRDTGRRAVQISGGDRISLSRADSFLLDTEIVEPGYWERSYEPGVFIDDAVGVMVSHNLIASAPHAGMLYHGNDLMISYNTIRDVCRETRDAGAIYSGRSWADRRVDIRYNHIYSLKDFLGGEQVHGIYLDDCQSGAVVFGNVLREIDGAALFHGGGWGLRFRNNIAVDCGVGYHVDERGVDWAPFRDDGSSWDMLARLRSYDFRGAVWSAAYPELGMVPDRVEEFGWLAYPAYSEFSRNVLWRCVTSVRGDSVVARKCMVDQDPRFADERSGDYSLNQNSPFFETEGVIEIPFSEIGVRTISIGVPAIR